jgi:E3 ubiquitin-protein ligase RFWD2
LQFNDLQDCYLQKRRQLANHPHNQSERDKNVIHKEGYNAGLADFQSVLGTFTQYRYKYQFSFHF